MGRVGKQISNVSECARRQWAADRALRPPMRSPGRPEPSRAVQWEFWLLIASGVTTVEASNEVGVSWPVASRCCSVTLGACRRSVLTSPRAATSRSMSVRRSRCCAPSSSACVTSPAGSAPTRERSHSSCVATRRRGVGSRLTAPWWRSGRRTRRRSARRPRSSKATTGCVSTSRIGSLEASADPTARPSPAP